MSEGWNFIMQDFLYLSLHPIALIFYSAVLFLFVMKKKEPAKTLFCLKCYCIFMMPLAIEALIRSMIYVRDIWGTDSYLVFFLIVSILVLCFCILTFNDKFSSLITSNIYICLALALIVMIVIFPHVTLIFEASLQILSVFGCIAAAFYGLSQYAVTNGDVLNEEAVITKKQPIFSNTLFFCVALAIGVIYLEMRGTNPGYHQNLGTYYEGAIYDYNKSTLPKVFFKLSLTEAVDMTDILGSFRSDRSSMNYVNFNTRYIGTGAISIVLKNKTYFIKYDIEAWLYSIRGVPSLGFGAYSRVSLEDYKNNLAKHKNNYNSPDPNSPYDGTGNVFFQRFMGPFK